MDLEPLLMTCSGTGSGRACLVDRTGKLIADHSGESKACAIVSPPPILMRVMFAVAHRDSPYNRSSPS
jgi:hypothetical protein